MLPEARAMHVCRELLLPPFCPCGVGGGEPGGGNWGAIHSCSHWEREKQLAQKRNRISSSHSLTTVLLGEVEVSVNIQTGQAVM